MNTDISDVLNQVRKSNTEYFSSLKSALTQGIINEDEVQKKISMKRKDIIKKHEEKYSVWQGKGKDNRWRTYLPDGSPKGKPVAKSKLEDLYDLIVDFYTRQQGFTVEQLYQEWIDYKSSSVRASSYIAKIKSDWRTYYKVDQGFINIDVRKMDAVYLEKWLHALIKKYNMTKKQFYNTTIIIRQGMKYAKKKGYIKENPFDEVEINTKLFRGVQKADSKTQVYTIEEQQKMEEEMWRLYAEKPEYTAPLAIIFMFYTGLRIGELVALRESDIEENQIHIQRQETRVFEEVDAEHSRMVGYAIVDHTKTEVGNRYVPLVPIAQAILKEVIAANRINGRKDEDFIFLSADGQRIKHGAIEGRIIDACERLGMKVKTAHKFRKTYISTLYDNGVPLEAIRKIVGHADERTTLHNYCFNRLTDEQTYNKVLSALSADKENEPSEESVIPCYTKVVSFSQKKKRGKLA